MWQHMFCVSVMRAVWRREISWSLVRSCNITWQVAPYLHSAADDAIRTNSVLFFLIGVVHHVAECIKLRSVTTTLASSLSQLLWET